MSLLPTILCVRSVDLPSLLPLSFFKSLQNWRSGLTLVYQSKFIFLIVKSSFKYSQSEKCINNSLFPDLIEIKHLCSEKRENNCSLLCPTKSFFLYIFQLKQVFDLHLPSKSTFVVILQCSFAVMFLSSIKLQILHFIHGFVD